MAMVHEHEKAECQWYIQFQFFKCSETLKMEKNVEYALLCLRSGHSCFHFEHYFLIMKTTQTIVML